MDPFEYPKSMSPQELDNYLKLGWYRMGQAIFTTDAIKENENAYPVYWLRIHLKDVEMSKTHHKIFKANKNFTVSVKPLQITDEMEDLNEKYWLSTIIGSPFLKDALLEGHHESIYSSYAIEIRDDNRLIAVGIFDNGLTSIAGIVNFYHPDYKKYSLGKYLMLLKAQYAFSQGKTWYYPGYIIQGFPKFDYKLFLDRNASEIYLRDQNTWIRFNTIVWEHGWES
jgi:arginine-tRNA-protein transferase